MTKITRDQLLTRYTNSSVAVKFQWNKVSSLINPFQESLLKTCLPESCVYEENEEDITISEDDETFNNLPCELQKFNLERIMKHGGCQWRQRREWGAKEALPSFNCFIYNMRWGGLVADDITQPFVRLSFFKKLTKILFYIILNWWERKKDCFAPPLISTRQEFWRTVFM